MILTWSRGQPDEGMPEHMLVETLAQVRQHPWWQARATLVLTLLRQRKCPPPASVLDVGCGWGVTLCVLSSAGYSVRGMDVSRRILELIDSQEKALIEADLTQPLPDRTEQFDAVLLLDVIEHLDDDRAALKRVSRLVKPDGLLIASVPARPDLFSEFDRIQGHRRRYTPTSLGEAFSGTGLAVDRVFWWGAWMVPILKRTRVTQSKRQPAARSYSDYLRLPPWPGPLLMRAFFRFEQGRAAKGALKTGTSLFAIASRKAGHE